MKLMRNINGGKNLLNTNDGGGEEQ